MESDVTTETPFQQFLEMYEEWMARITVYGRHMFAFDVRQLFSELQAATQSAVVINVELRCWDGPSLTSKGQAKLSLQRDGSLVIHTGSGACVGLVEAYNERG